MMLNTFFSSELILIMLIGLTMFSTVLWFAVPLGIVLLPLTTNVQPMVAIGTALLYRCNFIRARGTILAAVTIAVGAVVATQYAAPLMSIDPNTGIRAAFWEGSLEAFGETKGLGVGFGTEGIRSSYYFKYAAWKIDDSSDKYILTGLHNSVFNAGFRMGLLGFIAPILMIVGLFPGRRATGAAYWLFILMLFDISINVAVESTSFGLGLSFLMAYLMFLKDGGHRDAPRRRILTRPVSATARLVGSFETQAGFHRSDR
ncbi:hypothetical protein EAH79_16360 [Sphingomonas koreensis]|nr:hypothetical protein EAH79_16360 [Sphingomonas koreensis]